MPSISITDLFARIGQLTIENELLTAENQELKAALIGKEASDVPSEVPSTVPGPDDDSGLV